MREMKNLHINARIVEVPIPVCQACAVVLAVNPQQEIISLQNNVIFCINKGDIE